MSGRDRRSARRGSRCTPSRPSACCSTAGCSRARATSTGSSGSLEALEVPETLHALIAARLDGLTPDERRLVSRTRRCSARTFTTAGARRAHQARRARRSSRSLAALARKEIARPADRPALARARPVLVRPGPRCDRSPTRRSPAASASRDTSRSPSTSSRAGAPRRTRSSRSWPRTTSRRTALAPDADDAAEIKAKARELLARAGQRASSLAAQPRRRSATSSRRPSSPRSHCSRRELLERAGEMGAARREVRRSAHALRGGDRALRAGRTSARGGTRRRAPRRDRLVRGRISRGRRGDGAVVRGTRTTTSRDESLAAARRRRSAGCYYFAGERRAWPPRGSSSRSTSPRRSGCPRSIADALNTKALILVDPTGRGTGPFGSCAGASLRERSDRRPRCAPTQTSPTCCSTRDRLRGRARRLAPRGARARPPARRPPVGVGAASPPDARRSTCSASGDEVLELADESPEEVIAERSGAVVLTAPAAASARVYVRARPDRTRFERSSSLTPAMRRGGGRPGTRVLPPRGGGRPPARRRRRRRRWRPRATSSRMRA